MHIAIQCFGMKIGIHGPLVTNDYPMTHVQLCMDFSVMVCLFQSTTTLFFNEKNSFFVKICNTGTGSSPIAPPPQATTPPQVVEPPTSPPPNDTCNCDLFLFNGTDCDSHSHAHRELGLSNDICNHNIKWGKRVMIVFRFSVFVSLRFQTQSAMLS